jgi:hypothetical protein
MTPPADRMNWIGPDGAAFGWAAWCAGFVDFWISMGAGDRNAARGSGHQPVDKLVEKVGSVRGVFVDTGGERPPGLRIPALAGRLASEVLVHCLWIADCAR